MVFMHQQHYLLPSIYYCYKLGKHDHSSLYERCRKIPFSNYEKKKKMKALMFN